MRNKIVFPTVLFLLSLAVSLLYIKVSETVSGTIETEEQLKDMKETGRLPKWLTITPPVRYALNMDTEQLWIIYKASEDYALPHNACNSGQAFDYSGPPMAILRPSLIRELEKGIESSRDQAVYSCVENKTKWQFLVSSQSRSVYAWSRRIREE